jgi:hypothetical protein
MQVQSRSDIPRLFISGVLGGRSHLRTRRETAMSLLLSGNGTCSLYTFKSSVSLMVHTRRNTYPPDGNCQSIHIALLSRPSRRVRLFIIEQLWSHVSDCSSTCGSHGRGCDEYGREPKVCKPGPTLRVDEHVFLGRDETSRKRTKLVELSPFSSRHEPRRANA